MRPLISFVAGILLFTATAVVQSASQDRAIDFVARIGERLTDSSPHGTNVGVCVIILPDARFHLERRVQRLPGTEATLTVVESRLTSSQFRKLLAILDDKDIKLLPPYDAPMFPINVPWFYVFSADIPRGQQNQRVGYWLWDDAEATTGSPTVTAGDTKAQWARSKMALAPLLQWLRAIEAITTVATPGASSTLCDTSAQGTTTPPS
jgi:hypothetical protein